MRKTIRTYALITLVAAALAAPLSAAPRRGNAPDDFFAKLKNFIVHALDDAKIIFPTG
jgi:hypothetical protein